MSSPPAARRGRLGEREFIFFMALMSAMSALAIDLLLPAFAEMRMHFGLDPDATDLSLTITLFFFGTGIGNLFYGPLTDALGRKPVLVGSMSLYAAAALVAAFSPSLGVLYFARFVWGFAAAGPRTLSQAIVRDRFEGTAMARVMTLIQTAFFIAPVLAPLLGKGLVELGSWRYVMAFGVVSALTVTAWSFRLEETLTVENRRPLRLRSTFAGFALVVGNRATLGYVLAVMFSFGAFFSFLGSSELVFDDVFDRGGWFVPYFSVMSVVMAAVALLSNRILRVVPARHMALGAGSVMTVVSVGLLVLTLATGGTPPFIGWLVIYSLANASHIAFFPTGNSLALQPMGALAGTAAAVLGFMSSLGGALLASFIDRAIDGTVTPIAVGYVAYSALALGCQVMAARSAAFAETVA